MCSDVEQGKKLNFHPKDPQNLSRIILGSVLLKKMGELEFVEQFFCSGVSVM